MAVSVRAKAQVDRQALTEYGRTVSQVVAYQAAEEIQHRAKQNLTRSGRIHTGSLRDSIVIGSRYGNQYVSGYRVEARAPHAKYQEFGTRAHGPRRAKFMVFRIRGRGPLIFAKWVRGVRALHFMRDAAESVTVADFLPKR